MFKRAWVGEATLALVALTTLVFMLAVTTAMVLSEYAKVHSSNAAYQQNAEHDRRIASEEIASACENRTEAAFRLCIADRVETYYRDQATNEDLQAQQDMAFWAAALFVSSTILTAIGIWLLYRTLSATQQTLIEAGRTTAAAEDAVVETRRIGEAQTRAYIVLSPEDFGPPEGGTLPFSIQITIKNTGVTPARNVTFQVDARVLPKQDHDGRELFSVEFPDVATIDAQIGAGSEEKSNIIVDYLTPQERQSMIACDTHRLFVLGRVGYDDVFGNRRNTHLAAFYNRNDHHLDADGSPRWEWEFSLSGNGAD